jgi:CheY-like chemotaxis protein
MDTERMDIKNILLVEDDPQDVQLTLAGLKENHLANKVEVVRDGAEALDYLYHRGKFQARANGQPVVVMLDLKMPKVGGLEVLKQIKADDQLKMIPVVIFSSSRETPDLIDCYRDGANAYVVKPVDFHEFMQAVKQLGLFWAVVNEPPPYIGKEEIEIQSDQTIIPPEKENENGIPSPHFALGG